MQTIKAIIVDDEPLAHKVIIEYAKDIPFLEIVGQCYLATEVYSLLNAQSIDLIFLDIQMPKLNGLDFLKTLDVKPQVILTTAYQEYALESYELQVCDYLLKPFRFDRFLKAVNKAHQLIGDLSPGNDPSLKTDQKADQQIFVKVNKRVIQLSIKDIMYIESYGNYVKLWMGATFHLTARTLSSFEEFLDPDFFIRIHKSFVIQKLFMEYVEGNQVVMKNGNTLPIGKSHRAAVKQWLKE